MNNNKLIAEFMELENPFNEITDATLYRYKSVDEMGEFQFDIELHEMRYHLSWDWLMPAVKKCFCTGDNTFEWDAIMDAMWTCDIKIVHSVVVEFINEYNKTK